MDEENQINLQNVDVFAENKAYTPRGYQGLNPDPMAITRLSPVQIYNAFSTGSIPSNNMSSLQGGLSAPDTPSAFEKANIAIGAASGLAGIAAGLIGGGQRRREQRRAKQEYEQMMGEYKNFEFQNAYLNLENPFEDLRVSTEAAEFQAQQNQQALAQSLDALRSGGGGVGAAALAQSLANVQAQQTQRIAADISRQEVENEKMAAAGQAQIQQLQAQGQMAVQSMEFDRTETLLGMSQQRKAAADVARQQATASLIGGIGSIAGAALSGGMLPGGISSLFGGGK